MEYKATPIPSHTIAQILASFANSEGGGLVFGIRMIPIDKKNIEGLSTDFNMKGMVQKAVGLMEPQPTVFSDYFDHQGKLLFGIIVEKSNTPVLVGGQTYQRIHDRTMNVSSPGYAGRPTMNYREFNDVFTLLENERKVATSSKKRFLDHYNSTLSLYQPLLQAYYPADITAKVTTQQGKVFNRILFASCVDNFETYLSSLLYEIYLAIPNTLKSGESLVKVADVLACSDIEEIIQMVAANRVRTLQKGSVKGFIKDNEQIRILEAINDTQIKEIERILQIRHLYTHRNGIVDEGFLVYFRGEFQLNEEHQLSLEQMLIKLEYLVNIVSVIDGKAVAKYGLSTQDPA